MPQFDFIEIGTSNFRTLIQKQADDTTVGISVEPLTYYISQLPDRKNVIKENVAISFDDSESDVVIYYIPENVIIDKKLPRWLKGCNSLHDYHPKHELLGVKDLVIKETVKQIPISKLFAKHNVSSVNLLKIDTEGGDCDILLNLYNYLKNKPKSFYPKKIIFETNSLTDQNKLKNVMQAYSNLGYVKNSSTSTDTTLILQ